MTPKIGLPVQRDIKQCMVFVAAYFHSTHTCQVVGQELRVKQGKSAGLQSLFQIGEGDL